MLYLFGLSLVNVASQSYKVTLSSLKFHFQQTGRNMFSSWESESIKQKHIMDFQIEISQANIKKYGLFYMGLFPEPQQARENGIMDPSRWVLNK